MASSLSDLRHRSRIAAAPAAGLLLKSPCSPPLCPRVQSQGVKGARKAAPSHQFAHGRNTALAVKDHKEKRACVCMLVLYYGGGGGGELSERDGEKSAHHGLAVFDSSDGSLTFHWLKTTAFPPSSRFSTFLLLSSAFVGIRDLRRRCRKAHSHHLAREGRGCA